MQTVLQRRHRVSLLWASIVALLGVVACGGPPPSFSVFNQQPHQGSGEAVSLQTADQMHPLWTYQLSTGTPESLVGASGIVYVSSVGVDVSIPGNGENAASITPTVSGDQVNGDRVSVLDALDSRSGRRLWRFQAPEQPHYGARPLVVNDMIYFALTHQVCALNALDGAVRWCAAVIDRTKDTEYIVDGELAFEDGLLFIGANQTLIAVEAATGKRVWSVQTTMSSSHLATGDNLIYVSAADGQLSALDASTGHQVWRAKQVPDASFPNSFAPVPFLDDGTLYVLSGRKLVAYQGRRGDLLWQVSLDGGEHGGELSPPPPVFANVGGTPYILALEVNGGTLITPLTTQLVAYNLHTHQQLWSKQLPGHDGKALALSSDMIYVASATIDRQYPSPSERHYWLTLIDLRSGQAARQLQNNDSSFRVDQLVGNDGRLFVLGNLVDSGAGLRVIALGR